MPFKLMLDGKNWQASRSIRSNERPGLVPLHTQADVEQDGVLVVAAEDL